MRNKIRFLTFRLMFFAAFFLNVPLSSANESKDIETQKEVEEIISEQVQLIKQTELPNEKKEKLSDLIKLVNEHFKTHANELTDLVSKVLDENSKKLNKGVDPKLIERKEKSDVIYQKWLTYKIAMEPLYDLFIEKKETYSCNAFAEQIRQRHEPLAPQTEKTDIDPYTKTAMETSIEIADDLCKYAQDLL